MTNIIELQCSEHEPTEVIVHLPFDMQSFCNREQPPRGTRMERWLNHHVYMGYALCAVILPCALLLAVGALACIATLPIALLLG